MSMVGQEKVVDKLRELARNLWWTWQPNVVSIFRELDPALWRATDHNPVEFLNRLPGGDLDRLTDTVLHSRVDYAARRLVRVPPGAAHLGVDPGDDPQDAPGRLLLGRVRPP